jgi:hypothetical protein
MIQPPLGIRAQMGKFPAYLGIIIFAVITAHGQTFSSGSTGADGALDLSTMNCPNNICEVQLPESGILNYTTVNIPQGLELRFKLNSSNTPVFMLAQGAVTIAGLINVSAIVNCPGGGCGCSLIRLGPGGFRGGVYSPGFGPGGGTVGQINGRWVGPLSLVPIVGGSGGYDTGGFGNGGDGGGAIVIASSASIAITGEARANGSRINTCFSTGGGSGGAIRLIANSISVSGSLHAFGGTSQSTDYAGLIRIEAPPGQLTFSGTSIPPAILSTINAVIASVGGYPVPPFPASPSDTNTANVILPRQLTDPINVVIQGNNIPVGTSVTIQTSGSPSATTTTCALAGSLVSSTATCTISNANRSAITFLLAIATFDPPSSAQLMNPRGPNHVVKVRVESALGQGTKYTFLRANGTTIDQAKLPKKFLELVGL